LPVNRDPALLPGRGVAGAEAPEAAALALSAPNLNGGEAAAPSPRTAAKNDGEGFVKLLRREGKMGTVRGKETRGIWIWVLTMAPTPGRDIDTSDSSSKGAREGGRGGRREGESAAAADGIPH
ncbi:hypothetical protein CLOM_g9727, partial [Closterium sp. NIES-68]